MTEKANNEKTENKKKNSEVGPRRPLLRSKDDRVLWGVAGGLAAHVGFDPILVRIAFVLTTLFGGVGLLAYLVLAVALPEDDGEGNPVPESVGARLGRVLLVCLVAAVALSAAAGLMAVSAWTAATGHGATVAAIVIALGVAIAGVAFIGTSTRRRVAPWLLAAALVLAVPAGAVAAADLHFDGSIGKREYRPTTVADLPASGYELGTGQLIVDLRNLPWTQGQAISASAHLGIGQMIVSVPSNVCVVAHATAKAGELVVAGNVSQGVDPEVDQGQALSQAPRLNLDADIKLGQMIVTDEAPDQIETHGADYDHHQQEADSQRQVCGR